MDVEPGKKIRIQFDHLNLEAEGEKISWGKSTIALHEGGDCGSQIFSVHVCFCERNCRDKLGQFLQFAMQTVIWILHSLLRTLCWEFYAIVNLLLWYKCCQRISDILLLPCTGLKKNFLLPVWTFSCNVLFCKGFYLQLQIGCVISLLTHAHSFYSCWVFFMKNLLFACQLVNW